MSWHAQINPAPPGMPQWCKDDCGNTWKIIRQSNGVYVFSKGVPGGMSPLLNCSQMPIEIRSMVPCDKTRQDALNELPSFKKSPDPIKVETTVEVNSWVKYMLIGGAAFFVFMLVKKLWK